MNWDEIKPWRKAQRAALIELEQPPVFAREADLAAPVAHQIALDLDRTVKLPRKAAIWPQRVNRALRRHQHPPLGIDQRATHHRAAQRVTPAVAAVGAERVDEAVDRAHVELAARTQRWCRCRARTRAEPELHPERQQRVANASASHCLWPSAGFGHRRRRDQREPREPEPGSSRHGGSISRLWRPRNLQRPPPARALCSLAWRFAFSA